MFQPAVAPGRLKQYSPMMRELADRLIDGFADSEADFLKQFADPFPVLVVARLLDLPEDDFDWHRWLDGFEGASVDYLSPERQAAYLERNASLFRYLRGVLVDRAASPRDDLFSEIVRSKREELDAAELADDVLDELATDAKAVIGAATANTTSMLASTLRLLIDHPHAMQAVLEERGHIGRIVEESLRLESPVQWSPRVAKRDAVLSGVAIPAGARVIVLLGSANRDRCEFADAEEFDPQRSELRRQLGFGFGSHTCLGAPLARVEGQIAFDALFDRLTNFELAPGGWVEGTHVEFRGPAKMQITFDRR